MFPPLLVVETIFGAARMCWQQVRPSPVVMARLQPLAMFPASAPAAPWGAALSVFNGVDPNGVWKLFVVDDAGSDVGNIAGGWSLAITTGDGLTCCQHVLGAPKIVSTTNSGGNIFFSFASEPGATYYVEGKDSLNAANWQLLQTLTGDGTLKTLSYPINAPQQRFYRLRAQ